MAGGEIARVYTQLTSGRSESEWRAPVEGARVVKYFETDVLEMFPAPCTPYGEAVRGAAAPAAFRWRFGDGGNRLVVRRLAWKRR